MSPNRADSRFDESRGGISPPRAPRTVREPLDSYGSRCPAVVERLCLVHRLLPLPVGPWSRLNNAAPWVQLHYRAFVPTKKQPPRSLRHRWLTDLDTDDAAMTYERFIRCGSAEPVATTTSCSAPVAPHRYSEAPRPAARANACQAAPPVADPPQSALAHARSQRHGAG